MVIYKINNLFNKHDKGDQKVKTSFTKRCNQGAKRIGAVRYQRIGSVAITKHHPLLVLLVYVVLRKYLSRIASTNPQIGCLHVACHNWISNAPFGAPQTLT